MKTVVIVLLSVFVGCCAVVWAAVRWAEVVVNSVSGWRHTLAVAILKHWDRTFNDRGEETYSE